MYGCLFYKQYKNIDDGIDLHLYKLAEKNSRKLMLYYLNNRTRMNKKCYDYFQRLKGESFISTYLNNFKKNPKTKLSICKLTVTTCIFQNILHVL